VRRVQSRHRRVLGELNLSVEAMLMPTTLDNNEEQVAHEAGHGTSAEELQSSISPADDLLSRVGCDMDSGFSGSSSASYRYASRLYTCQFVRIVQSLTLDYLLADLLGDILTKRSALSRCFHRSGLGSLRRGLGKASGAEATGVQRKTKAAMIWKKGWKGWKKLHSFGSSSSSSSSNNKIIGESNDSSRLVNFDLWRFALLRSNCRTIKCKQLECLTVIHRRHRHRYRVPIVS